jgi:phosphate uptake regulator
MKRRIIKLGTTTLVTSLPSRWARQFGLKPGDYVDVVERNKDLVLSTEKGLAVMEKVLDCRKLTSRLSEEYLLAAYILGYHTIEILHEPRMREYKTKRMIKAAEFFQDQLRHLVGVEIIEQSETRTVIKELAAVTPEEQSNTVRRILLLTKEMGSALISALEKRDREALSGMRARHQNVRKFLIYFQRVLNKQGYTEFAKTNQVSILADNLWYIPGLYRVIADDTLAFKKPYSRKAVDALRIVHEAFVKFSELFFNYKPETAVELIDLREKFWDLFSLERHKMTAEDATLYGRIASIGGHLNHCVRVKFALEL